MSTQPSIDFQKVIDWIKQNWILLLIVLIVLLLLSRLLRGKRRIIIE